MTAYIAHISMCRHAVVAGFIVALIALTNLFFAERHRPDPLPPYGTGMVGSKACRSCHADIYKTHLETAHYRDSRVADAQSIKGSFVAGRNVFSYNPFMSVEMRKEGKRFVQSAQAGGTEMQKAYFDIVIGSGRKGQSYLYWGPDEDLFQLPISYYTEANSWCNSPGFPKMFVYDRPIPLSCLECHATYASSKGKVEGRDMFDKATLMLGIDCERCHGGGAAHVKFHTSNPRDTIGRFIVNTARMGRQVRLDGCALCHSGIRKGIKPPFTFQFGDTLSKYSEGEPMMHPDSLDVHGNQYELLASSKCFQESMMMDCSSCHNVHRNEVNDPKLFSARCMTCHGGKEQVHCSVKPGKGVVLENNCIDCHMPVLKSNKIRLDVNGQEKEMPDRIRTHLIGIYRSVKALER